LRTDAKDGFKVSRTPSNGILDGLPSELRESLISRMQAVTLPVGTEILKPGQEPQFAHFMTSGITSIVTFMLDGGGAEVGLIGREGVVEGFNLLGSAKSPTTAFVQVGGTALRIRYDELQKEAFTEPFLCRLLEFIQRHTFTLSQLAACTGLHEIEERLARWLLMVSDRLGSERFDLTQEFLAEMLGTRRTSVTLAAGSLQRSGLIEYKRGHIKILDREKLQSAACECYPIVHGLMPGFNGTS
jgi:CRP-like cAMP-binding protein